MIIDFISMPFSINMQDYKRLYLYKHSNSTYLVYDDNCFDNEECDFELKLWSECDKIENVNTVNQSFDRESVITDTKIRMFKILYRMYIPYVY